MFDKQDLKCNLKEDRKKKEKLLNKKHLIDTGLEKKRHLWGQ